MLRFDASNFESFLDRSAHPDLDERTLQAHRTVLDGSGRSAEMLGWRDLLLNPDDALLEEIDRVAQEIRERADVLLCIGIGGSYLGAQAVIDALTPYFGRKGDGPEILFAGHHISGAYHEELLEYLDGKSVYVNIISKSGTTLEPALAFRFIRQFMEDRFEDADRRIIVTTDPEKGQLNVLREEKGYRKFAIPDGVGGRFSVLTPVGLLPIAAAGIDARALFYGAAGEAKRYASADLSIEDAPALQYARDRFLLHEGGYKTEILAVFEPKLRGIGAWWQQLFGESEGKEGKGLFPTAVQYSTDLHSLGQYVQEGQRTLVETFLIAEPSRKTLTVPKLDGNFDRLNYLAGKDYADANRAAYEGTRQAHLDGGVPNCTLTMGSLDASTLGEALYFFEHAVAVGGYLLGIDPFDQPGVEAYKQEMFSRLGRP
jgi:glucose-6-phosphate isomerase